MFCRELEESDGLCWGVNESGMSTINKKKGVGSD